MLQILGETPNSFAKKLGYSRAQTIYDILSEKSAPSYDFFRKFADSEFSASINLSWLLTGAGEPTHSSQPATISHSQQNLSDTSEMEKGKMVEQLINHYANGNKTKFAKLLGVSPQTISAWIARNTFDNELIYTKCVNVSPQWLLTGKGEMLSSEPSATASPAQTPAQHDALVSKLLDTIKEQAEEIGRLKAQIDELEQRKRDDASAAASSKSALVG